MAPTEPSESGAPLVFRPCGRSFFVYYTAMAICFFGPQINPHAGLPPWLGVVLGVIIAAAVIYIRGQEYRVDSRGVSKVWRWTGRQQEIPWHNLGEILVRRGLTQTLFRVGNLILQDKSGGPEMFWFGLSNPKEVKALIEARSKG